MNVSRGGTALDTIVSGGGEQVVSSGGKARGIHLDNGGKDFVLSGGTAVGTTIRSGGTDFIGFIFGPGGGTVVSAVVDSGGVEIVLSGGTSSRTVVSSGGFERVNGGVVRGTTIRGTQIITLGGTAVGTILSHGVESIQDGTTSGTVVSSGGNEAVLSGGTASGTVVSHDGFEYVSGGLALGTTIRGAGAVAAIVAGGTAIRATIGNGGLLEVLAGGVAYDATVGSGGRAITSSGTLTLSGGTIGAGGIVEAGNGGTVIVSGTVINSGTLFAADVGGMVEIAGVVKGGTTKVGNGIVDIQGAGSETVTFNPGGIGVLQLDGLGGAYTGKVTSFGQGGLNPNQSLDFTGVNFAGASVTFTSAASHTSGTLSVTDGTHSATVTLVGHYTTANFTSANDIAGHLKVFDPTLIYTSAVTLSGGTYSTDVIAQSSVTVAKNGGTVIVDGNMEALGPVSITDGILEATNGGDINLESSVTLNGPPGLASLEAIEAGTITVQGPVLNGSNGFIEAAGNNATPALNMESSVTNLGLIKTDTFATLTMEQDLVNSNTIQAFAGSFIAIGAGPTNPYTIINRGAILGEQRKHDHDDRRRHHERRHVRRDQQLWHDHSQHRRRNCHRRRRRVDE